MDTKSHFFFVKMNTEFINKPFAKAIKIPVQLFLVSFPCIPGVQKIHRKFDLM